MATQEKPVSNQLLKTAAALASILLAASLASPPAAALAAGDGDRIVKTFTYMEASGMPEGLVPSSIEFGGNAYKLDKQGEPYVDDSYERQTAELEHDTTVEAGVLDLEAAVHDDREALGLAVLRGLLVPDAELHPDGLRADGFDTISAKISFVLLVIAAA